MERLSKEDQTELVKSAQSGDMSAFQKLMEELGAYVRYVAKKVFAIYEENGTGISDLSIEDVYQAGFYGLLCAINNYKPDQRAVFTTYAYSCIAGEVKAQIIFELNRLGITHADIKIIGESMDDEENGLANILISEQISALDEIMEKEEKSKTQELFTEAISALSEDEKKVLFMIHGIDHQKTSNHKKIAKELGLPEIMIKKTIVTAMNKISAALGE